MYRLAAQYPNLTRLVGVGSTHQGRPLLVMEIVVNILIALVVVVNVEMLVLRIFDWSIGDSNELMF